MASLANNFSDRPRSDDARVEAVEGRNFQPGRHISVEISRLWRRAIEHRFLLLGIFLFAILAAIAVFLLQTPLYRSTAQIEISRVDYGGAAVIENGSTITERRDPQYYFTQYELLRSRSVATSVVDAEGLNQNPLFLEAYDIEASEIPVQTAVNILLSDVSITPIQTSNLVDISYSSPSAELSSLIANSWANEFLRLNFEKRFGDNILAREQLEDQLQETRARLEESEAELNSFANANGIIILTDTNADGDTTRSSLLAEELSSLSQALGQATVARIQAQSNAAAGGPATGDTGAQASVAAAEAELANLRTTLGPLHPRVQAAEARLSTLRSAANTTVRDSRETQNAAYRSALRQEQELQRRFNQVRSQYLGQQGDGVQYGILEREVQTNRELYDGLLQRFKALGTVGDEINNMTVVEAATPANGPYHPNILLNILIGLVGAALASVGVLYVMDLFDQTIRDPEDVGREFGLPLLGVIPKSDPDDFEMDLEDRHSSLSESYASARSSLQFAGKDGDMRSLMITSTQPGEGKTTSALALAKSFADVGEKVVLLDMDLRRRGLSTVIGSKNSGGVTGFLTGADDKMVPDRHETFDFDFLGARSTDISPVTLLSGGKLQAMLRMLEERYDRVIIDGPPVIGLADAPQISTHVDGVVFMMQANTGNMRAMRRALSRLQDADANILGAVLSQVDNRNNIYGYNYDYVYKYGSVAS